MDASILNLTRLFELTRRYEVPLYQRPYVWKRETHWKPLWEDVTGVASRIQGGDTSPKAHFIGALVLERQEKSIAYVETRLVIDGQQRLTTLQLLLEAFADVVKARGMTQVFRRVEKLVRNDEVYAGTGDDRFKVWPTTRDQDSFRRVMLHDSAAQVRGELISETGSGIPGAYLFFVGEIEEWLGASPGTLEERADALYRTLREYIRLVVIELSDDDDAQAIFETLNARGEPLRPSDLVKNVLLQRARNEKADVAAAYRDHWKPFDEDPHWGVRVGRGHSARPRIDVFLQHFLTARLRDEVAVASLYSAFRDFLKRAGTSAVEHLQDLAKSAAIYRTFDPKSPESSADHFFMRLRVLEVGTAYPWLLEVFRKHAVSQEHVLEALHVLESFLVRRTVCLLPTRGYNRLFLEALAVIDGPSDQLAARLKVFLLSGKAESNRWPGEAEFRRAWLEEPLYERLRVNRVRLILEELERGLHSKHTEKVTFGDAFQVEHVLPQSWDEHWPMPPPGSIEQRLTRDRALHSIGNLTLLTQSLNPAVSNGAWVEKRAALDQHCVLMLNRELARQETWDEVRIRARGEALFEVARSVWPRPEEQVEDVPAPSGKTTAPEHVDTSTIPINSDLDYCDRVVAKTLVLGLIELGLDEQRFRLLHHFKPQSQPTWSRLKGFLDYCDQPGRFSAGGTNSDTAQRVAVCLAARKAGLEWEQAIHLAHERVPAPWTASVG